MAEQGCKPEESKILHAISALPSSHPGRCRLMTSRDHFHIDGPNGVHVCLVLDMLGPSVRSLYGRFRDGRLSGKVANSIARQVLLGLSCSHDQRIGHGGKSAMQNIENLHDLSLSDLHTRNIAVVIPGMKDVREHDFLAKLEAPETEDVQRIDGQALEENVPRYIVRPTAFPVDMISSSPQVKIIDFGQSFTDRIPSKECHTPMSIRAPEIMLGDVVDYRLDLWSMGCMVSLASSRASVLKHC